MQSHGIAVKKTTIGDRVSINFSNLEKKNISRGSTLFDINELEAVKNIIAKVNMVKNTKWLLKNNQRGARKYWNFTYHWNCKKIEQSN